MRRTMLPVAVCGILVLSAGVRADDKAKEIIKQGIAARGGEEKLSKVKGYREKTKGTISIMNMDIDFSSDSVSAPPTKMKTELKMEVGGMSHSIEVVFNGETMRRSIDGMMLPLQDAEKEDAKQRMQVAYAMRLTPLLDEKAYQSKALPDAKVDGKDAAVVQITGKDMKETKFYFDKTTHLLALVEYEGVGPMGTKGKQELHLSEYKEFDGVKQPTKLMISNDGTKFMEQSVTEYKPLEKVDDKEFAD
ncbi:MAG TPA: hypothetical protein VKS79_06515 [Gemmataceae bacterium]|nr:hypothetical protein [Gemmataceae bacterium]